MLHYINKALFYVALSMLNCFNVALLRLRFTSVQLFDVGRLDVAPFHVAPFKIDYLMRHFLLLQWLMLH